MNATSDLKVEGAGAIEGAPPPLGPYRWFLLFNVVMVLFIFAEPTIARLTEGNWKRGHFVFENTVSLDSHAAFGYFFVLLFVAQSVLGFSLLKRERLAALHRALGRLFVFGAAPLFIFIGARPFTDWLGNNILRNGKGYIKTGRDLITDEQFPKIWKQEREPFLLETCQPGIFAAGDVRSGAMNRVASAVGEGAMAIKFVHEYLAEI